MNSGWPIEFLQIASAGYYVALRVGFAFPVDEKNEFPTEWVDHYTNNGYMLRDPNVRWAYRNVGAIKWSDLSKTDEFGILQEASKFDLNFGVAICCSSKVPTLQRSYGAFARSDREFTKDEVAKLGAELKRLHDELLPPGNLTNAELEALKLVKEGLRLKEIAFQLGVSEGAIKQRLAGAKRKFGARTNAHAASRATELRLI